MSLKSNVIANYIGTSWNSVMNIIFVPYYIKYLGMEAYGLIGFYTMLQVCLSLLDLGMTPTLSREMARFKGGEHKPQTIKNLLRSLEIICLSIATTYCLIIWLSSDWVAANWLNANKLPLTLVTQSFQIIGLVTALRFIEGLYRGALLGLQRQVAFNIVYILTSTLRNFGAVIVLAYITPSIKAYFLWQGTIAFLTATSFIALVYQSLPKTDGRSRFSLEQIKHIWRFASGVIATTFLALALTQLDKVILSKILPLDEFGNYSLVTTVTTLLIMLVGPITQAHYPKISELKSQDDIGSLKHVFHRGSQLATAICSSAAFILIFFGNRVIYLWTGNPELSQKIFSLLRIMALGTYFNSLMQMPYILQLAYGWSSFAAKVNLIAVIFLFPTILIVTPIYGAIGAAWVWVALNCGYVFISSHFMFRKILQYEKWTWFIKDLFIPALSSLITVALFFKFMPSISEKLSELLYIFAAGITAVIISSIFSNKLRDYARAKFQEMTKTNNKTGNIQC